MSTQRERPELISELLYPQYFENYSGEITIDDIIVVQLEADFRIKNSAQYPYHEININHWKFLVDSTPEDILVKYINARLKKLHDIINTNFKSLEAFKEEQNRLQKQLVTVESEKENAN